jgi:predicted nucleic acid-binding protein
VGRLSPAVGPRPYLDANVIIYLVEGHLDWAGAADALALSMDAGELRCTTSLLTLAEVLVRPKRERDSALELAFREFLSPTDALAVAPIS